MHRIPVQGRGGKGAPIAGDWRAEPSVQRHRAGSGWGRRGESGRHSKALPGSGGQHPSAVPGLPVRDRINRGRGGMHQKQDRMRRLVRDQPWTTARPPCPQGCPESTAAWWKKLDTAAEKSADSELSTWYKRLSRAKTRRIFTKFSAGAPVILFAAALDTWTNVRI